MELIPTKVICPKCGNSDNIVKTFHEADLLQATPEYIEVKCICGATKQFAPMDSKPNG